MSLSGQANAMCARAVDGPDDNGSTVATQWWEIRWIDFDEVVAHFNIGRPHDRFQRDAGNG